MDRIRIAFKSLGSAAGPEKKQQGGGIGTANQGMAISVDAFVGGFWRQKWFFYTCWWFQTCFFHNIWDVILPIDLHIFQDGQKHQPVYLWEKKKTLSSKIMVVDDLFRGPPHAMACKGSCFWWYLSTLDGLHMAAGWFRCWWPRGFPKNQPSTKAP